MSRCCALAFHQTFVTVADSGKLMVSQALTINHELRQWVEQQGLRGKKTVGILGPTDYQLLRIRRPDALPHEMTSAILWQEQAHFSLPTDQLFVDYLECPVMSNPSTQTEKRLYVVAVAKRLLKERYQACLEASLRPIKITVPECIYAHYVSREYRQEPCVIWVNYFSDAPQVFAFYQQALVATVKLPKSETAAITEAYMAALNLFYLAEVKPFSDSPLWLMNGALSIEPSMQNQFAGRVQWLKTPEEYPYARMSHAYYGVKANE